MFKAANVYSAAKLLPWTRKIKEHQQEKEDELEVSVDKNPELFDLFKGVKFKWVSASRVDGLVSSIKKHQYSASSRSEFDNPATFDTIAMDPEMKRELIEDLDRFVEKREFYRRVGKAWKRGYLFCGPPGTGKSSLAAAMANYLKFEVYDLDLKEVQI
ncbi:BCS1 AAA-TYPE ATPASE [Salix purpurea]|uniref:BCS1 AAA-TYPE ATPASE n=1 Tax=Salix purpurea TaxID=77065 RepID=A0A9Q0SP22_SALPP|nr:BCS1 AAA-TYPE ATPASE [Salix purpurea]